jgi:hypothetical protein
MALKHVAHFDQIRRLHVRIGDGEFVADDGGETGEQGRIEFRSVKHGVHSRDEIPFQQLAAGTARRQASLVLSWSAKADHPVSTALSVTTGSSVCADDDSKNASARTLIAAPRAPSDH